MRSLIGLILFGVSEATADIMWTLHHKLGVGASDDAEDRFYEWSTVAIGPVFAQQSDCLVVKERVNRITIHHLTVTTRRSFTDDTWPAFTFRFHWWPTA